MKLVLHRQNRSQSRPEIYVFGNYFVSSCQNYKNLHSNSKDGDEYDNSVEDVPRVSEIRTRVDNETQVYDAEYHLETEDHRHSVLKILDKLRSFQS